VLAVHQEGGKEGTGREEGGGGEPEATTPKCPYCGSTDIVWDHQRGYVVCAGCGTVIEDVSIDYERSASKWRFFKELERKAPSTREAIIARERVPKFRAWLREAVKRVREYERALREARVAREREIREARRAYREILALLNKPVILMRVKGSIIDERVREFIEQNEALKRIVEVLERDPILKGLSYRVKLGLALAIRELVREGDVDIVLMARLGLKNPLVEFVVERETAVVMVKKSRLSNITSKPTNGIVFGIRSENRQCLFGEFEIQGSAEEVLKMIVDESKEYVQRLKAREVSRGNHL